MHEYLALIVGGIANGSVVAIAAMGLVLSFKASGIFNFAHGAVGAVAAGIFYQLRVLNGVPWGLALVITLLVAGVGLGLVMERVAFFVSAASTTMKVVATVGVMISLTALFTLRFGGVKKQFPAFLPDSGFRVGGVNVGWDQLVVVVIGLAAAVGMTVFFRRTLLGRSMRAVVDDPVLLAHLGVGPSSVRRWAWIIGTVFASVAGVLIAPSLGLDGTSLTLLVVESFGAAAIGGFANLPLTYVGAVLIQVGVAVTTKWASGTDSLRSLPTVLPFVVLFLVLLLTPKRRLVEVGASLQQRVSMLPSPSWRMGAARLVPLVVLLVVLPELVGDHLLDWMQGVVFVILMMSLSLLVRTSNQISLCQMSFAAVGAVACYHLQDIGFPWPLAVAGAGLVAIPVGCIVAIPAVRLSGVYLALATLAFGIVMETAVYQTFLMFGADVTPLTALRPSFAQSDREYYYVLLVVLAVAFVLVRLLERSRLGQLLRGKADAPQALEALGIRNSVLQTVAFSAAAFFAGLAGAVIGPIFFVVGVGNFPTIPTSIMLVALLVLGARNPRLGTLGASVLGAVGLVVLPQYIGNSTVLSCLNLLFGLAAVEAAVASTRALPPTSRARARLRALLGRPVGPAADTAAPAAAVRSTPDRVLVAAESAAPTRKGVKS
ncbi:Branched-chain amino acid ABC-type transport system, permease component [Jatrophihabitans endophyticus]|uniref:Branched-chain amino acid ABC-type transport system, permease component n=1 Tax=Jatrophihabitans endophyticus TaxID=1206085 RepID=A0A1M5PQZ7_9ACTN|nr:ABC transporter permease [Jatrophihabitans endophyticus]SHH04152.1 Branched-chain amino acid ABC-type transport system, permease component [Jatrophihabitans endophyticus]